MKEETVPRSFREVESTGLEFRKSNYDSKRNQFQSHDQTHT